MGTYASLIGQSALLVAIFAVIAVIAPTEVRLWIALCGAVALVFFIVISLYRHKKINNLILEIDEVLHHGRAIDFSNCTEGDIAALTNELGKVVARLSLTTELLESEKHLLSDALADISHQICTPLTAAMLMLPAIESAPDEQARIRALRELESMLDRISWLVTTLLKIAKIDAGAFHVQAHTVRASDVIHKALAPLETALDLRDVAVTLEIDETAEFTGDSTWFTEALENIMKNCMEHTPPGGNLKIVCQQNALATTIVVSDTGPGIPAADLPYIFDRFYRGKEDVTNNQQTLFDDSARNPTGFGIGLSLAHSLISAQGGTLRASNSPSAGAVFTISFPKSIL